MRNKTFFFIAGVMALFAVSCSKSPYTVREVGVVTLEATDVTDVTVNLNGALSKNLDTSVEKHYGFLYSDDKSELEGKIKQFVTYEGPNGHMLPSFSADGWGLSEDNSFYAKLEFLNIDKTYYYVAGVWFYEPSTGKRNVFFGEIKSFTTNDRQVDVTSSAGNVAINTATLYGGFSVYGGMSYVYEYSWAFSFLYSDIYSTFEDLVSSGTVVGASVPEFRTSFSSELTGLTPNKTYYYVTRVTISGKAFYSEVKSFTTNFSTFPAVEVVDLGLSVKWRGWNIGANNPVEYGVYYAWGETLGYHRFIFEQYKFGGRTYIAPNKYNSTDKKIVLEPEDDVASARLGGKWRMPTEAEWTELITNCTWTWKQNFDWSGVNGMLVTANNGNSIFLPAAGHEGYELEGRQAGTGGRYWSSSLDTGIADWAPVGCCARYVAFLPDNTVKLNSDYRCLGYSVRPVQEK